MIIFPAIDIKDKKCVRLTQGDFDKVNVYGEDPSLMAKKWAGYGAEFIHVVNLNGSRDEVGINDETLAKVAKAVDVPIQVGGGIRDEKRVKELLDLGIEDSKIDELVEKKLISRVHQAMQGVIYNLNTMHVRLVA